MAPGNTDKFKSMNNHLLALCAPLYDGKNVYSCRRQGCQSSQTLVSVKSEMCFETLFIPSYMNFLNSY